jgi:bacitracin synthase 3
MSDKRTVVISTCGFYTAEGNYDGVRSLFDHMCGRGNYAQVLCGQGELFRVPELRERTDAYLQHTVGLVFKIFPVAVDLRDFPALEDFLREVNRQLVEGFAHSICDYGTLDNVALEDALDVNYITNVGDASDLGILNPRELELEASYEATECRVELYLTEEDGQVNLAIEYQKNAYAEGSMKKFLNLYVEKFRQLVKG